jgi:hypothetical protein
MKELAKRIINKIKPILIEKNEWYLHEFSDCTKFWNNFPFNLEIVNLGSSSAFYGFDYSELPIKAANWAIRPQSFPQDFALLKTYYSYLGPKAIVLIVLCPYSSCFKSYTDISLEKYYTILHPGVIEEFSLEKQKKIYNKKNKPWELYKIQLFKGMISNIKSIIRRRKRPEIYTYQPMNKRQLEEDAMKWINGWKKQFNITDMNAPLPIHIKEGREKRVSTLKDIISFCKERELRPVIVLPPITQHLSSKMSETFRNNYIYSFLEEVNLCNTPFLNYLDDNRFQDGDFFNSFFLNRNGAKKFTKIIYDEVIKIYDDTSIK